MFAYVYYIDDKVKEITSVNNIKSFDIKQVGKPFLFDVLWTGISSEENDGEAAGVYYKAMVLATAKSRKELEERVKTKRITVPKLQEDVSENDSNNSEEEEVQREIKESNKMAKDQLKVKKVSKTKRLQEIIDLNSKSKKCKPQFVTKIKKQSNVEDWEEKYWTLNKKYKQQKEELRQMETEHAAVKNLNLRLQQQLLRNLENIKDVNYSQFPIADKSYKSVNLERGSVRESFEKIDLELESGFKTPPRCHTPSPSGRLSPTSPSTDNVDGINITREQWAEIDKNKGDSLYVKAIQTAIWGTEELKNRSVTGLPCNRLKTTPKRKLTPSKYNFIKKKLEEKIAKESTSETERKLRLAKLNRYLGEKINDIDKKCKAKQTSCDKGD